MLIVSLLLVNIVMANFVFDTLSGSLQDYRDDKEAIALGEINDNVHQAFDGSEKSQWQQIAAQLERDFGYTVEIYQSDNVAPISPLKTNQVPSPDAYMENEDWLDVEHSYITYSLADNYLVDVSPAGYSASGLEYLVDWFAWFTCALVNILVLSVFLWRAYQRQQHLTQQVASLVAASARLTDQDTQAQLSEPLDTQQQVKLLSQAMAQIKQQNDSRLLMQRDLLHGVAHEFRSPMARLQFALDMLQESPEQERPQLHQTMLKSLSDLDELVKELLYYARLEDIQSRYDFESLSILELESICQLACEKVQEFYSEIRFSVNIHCTGSDSVQVLIERNLMLRLLNNLIRNAGRFAQQQCLIRLSLDEQCILLRVEDDGMGIPPGKTERIFEPFTRLDASRSRDSGGCGLGLAIVASIAKRHKGQISVGQSELGGAKFTLRLPLIKSV